MHRKLSKNVFFFKQKTLSHGSSEFIDRPCARKEKQFPLFFKANLIYKLETDSPQI